MIDLQHIYFQYDKKPFIQDISLCFREGKITFIIGPNGSGKSTLLMLLGRIYHVQKGFVLLKEKNIKEYTLKEFAQNVALVHQKNAIPHDVDVETIVGYGRLPYLSYYQKLSKKDYEIIDWAMQVTGLTPLKKHRLKTLSGGQQQRVWIAMALAQKTPMLLLDEPTTYLDMKFQIEILNLIKKINEELKITIIMVHHDINQAMYYSDDIVAMKDGHIQFVGDSNDVICEDSLQALFDCKFKIMEYEGKKTVLNIP